MFSNIATTTTWADIISLVIGIIGTLVTVYVVLHNRKAKADDQL